MTEAQEFQERIGRIEGLVQRLDVAADPNIRAAAKELVQLLMEMHGAGLERMMEMLSNEGEAGARLIDSLGRDPLVSSLLVLYNLHPDGFETRVERGIESARSVLRKQGVSLDVVAKDADLVHVRVIGLAAQDDLQPLVRETLYEHVPDAANVIVEGGRKQPQSGFVPLASLLAGNEANLLAVDSGVT